METWFARKTLVGSHEKMNSKTLNNHCIACILHYVVEVTLYVCASELSCFARPVLSLE